MVAHVSIACSKSKVGLDSPVGTCVAGDNYLVIHDQLMSTVIIQKMATEMPR